MKQAIIKKGVVLAEEIPAPKVEKGTVLIRVAHSCISAGTEMSSVQTSGKPLYKRALEKPEEVKKVIDKVRKDGLLKTVNLVRQTLDAGAQTGYSVSGIVEAVGEGVSLFKIGDKVAAAGAGIANHAEYVNVPKNLVMRVPDELSLIDASTVTLGGIAMQGVRRADLRMGEYAVVVGMGILGLLTIQMLKHTGVRVVAVDIDDRRLSIAKELGAELILNPTKEDTVMQVHHFSNGRGADAVLFTAATHSSKPLSDSFKMCRKKGKVVLIGVSGMEINRADIYAKELDFQISTSYGPGRYDDHYEIQGQDYPYAYVRWTENRNMEEYLRLLSIGTIDLKKLINGNYPIEEVEKAYDSLKTSEEKPLMIILDYPKNTVSDHSRVVITSENKKNKNKISVALVGAGSFAVNMHLPNIQSLSSKYKLHAVVNRTGHKAKSVANKYGANYATTDFQEILNDQEVDLVMIATRHDSHANYVLQALKAGKNVFVEKPLAINQAELDEIKAFYETEGDKPLLMVGFNRRFSKYTREIKKHTDNRINPLFIRYRMNAGHIPLDHWLHQDGGRIVGEGCHLIDLMSNLTNSKILEVSSQELSPNTGVYSSSDNKSFILKYKDGSVAQIDYFATGNKKLSKEYMEIHFDGKSILMDDYKSLKFYGLRGKEITTSLSSKGQLEELEILHETLSGKRKEWPIELWDMIQTTEVSFLI